MTFTRKLALLPLPIAILCCALAPMTGHAGAPAWTHEDTLKRVGSTLYVVCSGSGPAQDLARRDALDHCRTTAADQANGHFKVQSLSIETEHSANFHQEVSSNKTVTSLVCNPEKEHLEEKDGTYQAWIKCKYDLSKAKVVADDSDEPNDSDNGGGQGLIKNRESLSEVPKSGGEVSDKKLIVGDNRQLVLTTIPQCEEILIRGERPRSVKCDEMPKTVFIFPTDKEIIVRASGGYLPKHIKLNGRAPASHQTTENLEVYLERN